MMIHEITQQVGRHKRRRRVGRGPGSGHGKTAGRGHKGAGSRAGWGGSLTPGYEGGQMPYFRRVPKRGFNNARFANRYVVINLRILEARFQEGEEVNPQRLAEAGLLSNASAPVKILGAGDITRRLTVTASAFSGTARQKIEAAGGECLILSEASSPS